MFRLWWSPDFLPAPPWSLDLWVVVFLKKRERKNPNKFLEALSWYWKLIFPEAIISLKCPNVCVRLFSIVLSCTVYCDLKLTWQQTKLRRDKSRLLFISRSVRSKVFFIFAFFFYWLIIIRLLSCSCFFPPSMLNWLELLQDQSLKYRKRDLMFH